MIRKLITKVLKPLKESKTLQISLALLFIVVAVIVTVTFDLAEVKAFIQQNRSQAILISIIVYFLLGFTLIPASPLTLFIALLMGPVLSVITATVGNTLAAILEYHIGKTVGDVFDVEERRHKLPFGLGKLPINSPYFLMAGRALPLGKRGLSLVAGAYHVPIVVYLWTTVLMYIIEAVLIAYGITSLIRLF